jgi:hypothetical protein
MIFSLCARRTARASTASLRVVGAGVLCGAVSSNAHRWGALSRPSGGLFLRVPLRGHLHVPAQICNCTRAHRGRPQPALSPGHKCAPCPDASGDSHPVDRRRGAPRAQAREQLVHGLSWTRIPSKSAAEWRFAGRCSESLWEGGQGVLVGRVKRATKETRD